MGALPFCQNTDGKDSVQKDSVCFLHTGRLKKKKKVKLLLGYILVYLMFTAYK